MPSRYRPVYLLFSYTFTVPSMIGGTVNGNSSDQLNHTPGT